MSVLATDNFDRTDAANLGSNWTMINGNIAISSNQAAVQTANVLEDGYYNAVSPPADQYAKVTLISTTPVEQLVAARKATSGFTFYGAGRDSQDFSGSQSTFWLLKKISGSPTSLGSSASALSGNDLVELDCQGTTITGKVGGVSKVSTTDSSISSGVAGLALKSTTIVAAFDDFEVGSIGSVVSIPLILTMTPRLIMAAE